MTVDHQIVRWFQNITVLLHIGATIRAVLSVKSTLQIVVRIINRLHNGIIDVRIFHANPTDQIIVLLIQLGKLRQDCLMVLKS